jgi:hypothetical protein
MVITLLMYSIPLDTPQIGWNEKLKECVCLVQRWRELSLIELSLTELILVKSELGLIDLCLDTLTLK